MLAGVFTQGLCINENVRKTELSSRTTLFSYYKLQPLCLSIS